jgi:Ca2+-transporting ATPase
VAIADPIRPDVPEAIRICTKDAHVRVIIVTGDNKDTAAEIARQIGLLQDDGPYQQLDGVQFAEMSDEELLEHWIPKLKILSRAKPEDKARLVGLLQRDQQVVAVTGDGTNDALALSKAEVGISMGSGTSRAKEASDITIIDNSFASINNAILWGRSLYLNIKRFILFQMTINLCACLIVLIGAFLGMDSPLTVTQMLWVNLIMDTFAAMALSSLPADRKVMYDAPRNPKSHIIDRSMVKRILLVGATMFVFLFGLWQLMWHTEIKAASDIFTWKYFTEMFNFTHKDLHVGPKALSIFFSMFVMLQFWNIFNVKYFCTNRGLFLDVVDAIRGKLKDNTFSRGFIFISLAILLGQILIVQFAGSLFNVVPLNIQDWLVIIAMTSPVLLVPELWRTAKYLMN